MFKEVQRTLFYIVCDDCNVPAGPAQENVEWALADAVGEDFQNYGPGDGTGKTGVWRCPECALAYEESLGFEVYAAEHNEADDGLLF